MYYLKGVVHPQNDFLSIDYSCLGHLSSIAFLCIPKTKNGFSKFTPIDFDRGPASCLVNQTLSLCGEAESGRYAAVSVWEGGERR